MITLLKCETCGGSDFEKHKLIDEFLVCSNCGNQYMKEVRAIEKSLPIDLKVKIQGNNNDLEINNAIIKGNNNDVVGNYNIVIGNNNDVEGIGNIAKGNNNNLVKKNKKKFVF